MRRGAGSAAAVGWKVSELIQLKLSRETLVGILPRRSPEVGGLELDKGDEIIMYTTQMDAAKKGIVTGQMCVVAQKEKMDEEDLVNYLMKIHNE